MMMKMMTWILYDVCDILKYFQTFILKVDSFKISICYSLYINSYHIITLESGTILWPKINAFVFMVR